MLNYEMSDYLEMKFEWNSQIIRDMTGSPYFHPYGGYDDYFECYTDNFFLKTEFFKKNADLAHIKYFEKLLNGTRNLLSFGNPYTIKISVENSSYFPAPKHFKINKINKDIFEKTELIAQISIFGLANDKISYLLQVFENGNNFPNFFKIYETIKKFSADNGNCIYIKILKIDSNILQIIH